MSTNSNVYVVRCGLITVLRFIRMLLTSANTFPVVILAYACLTDLKTH